MMRGRTAMAMAVRNTKGKIALETQRLKPATKWYNRIPVLRGVVAFASTMVMGVNTLMKSAEISMGEEEGEKLGKVATTIAVILGIGFSVGLFIVLPSVLTSLLIDNLLNMRANVFLSSIFEGVVRLAIFVTYLLIVSRLKDIRRTFMYHGAEHKTINCYESGAKMTVANIQKNSTRHNRCGTTFLFFVMVLSILVFSLTNYLFASVGILNNGLSKVGLRLLLLPLVAGLSYELLKALAKAPDNWLIAVLRAPGLALQRLTTYPPEDDMVEIALTSFLAVLDMDADENVAEIKFGQYRYVTEYNKLVAELAAAGVAEPSEADWIMCHATDKSREQLAEIVLLDQAQMDKVDAVKKRRIEGEPLDYILGVTEFYGRRIVVNSNVLIPRMETELLVECVLEEIAAIEVNREINGCADGESGNNKSDTQGAAVVGESGATAESMQGAVRVLDVCCGSGCIAAVVSENTGAAVVAIDISEEAVKVATINAPKADIRCGDMFAALSDGDKFDIIVSNPPYIATEIVRGLAREVLAQPFIAYDGGVDGLDFYRILAEKAPEFLSEKGKLMMEIGFDQGQTVVALLDSGFENVIVKKDYDGNDRMVIAQKRL